MTAISDVISRAVIACALSCGPSSAWWSSCGTGGTAGRTAAGRRRGPTGEHTTREDFRELVVECGVPLDEALSRCGLTPQAAVKWAYRQQDQTLIRALRPLNAALSRELYRRTHTEAS